jgi:hypothetical protein
VFALLVLFGANTFSGTLALPTAGLCIINAVVVALTARANGGYTTV